MAKKRFTDIEIWDKEWYMDLSPKHKCLIRYIFDKCDASGCWKPNWKLASLHINDMVTFVDLSSIPKDQYEILDNGKIFLPDFINFQYGTLSEKSPAHNPIFKSIEKNNLSDRVFNRVCNNPKEEDKEKDKEEEVDKEKEILKNWEFEKTSFLNDETWMYKFCTEKDVSKHVLDIMMVEFISEIELKEDHKTVKELKNHFTNTFNKNKKNGTTKKPVSNPGGTFVADPL